MRTITAISTLAVALILFAFTSLTDKSAARVNNLQGFYIFTDCQPLTEYKYLGSVKKAGTFSSGQYSDVRNALAAKARKEFPEADGLILTFTSGSADRCDAIKFKE